MSRRRQAEREASQSSHHHHREDGRSHSLCDIAGLRSDCHADADLAASLQHRVVEYADRARGTSRRRVDPSARGFGPDVRTTNVAALMGCNPPLVSIEKNRTLGHLSDLLPHVAVERIPNYARNLIAAVPFREPLSKRTCTGEELPCERFVDDCNTARWIAGAETSSLHQRNFHDVQPTGRDIHKVGQNRAGRRTID